MKKILHSLRYLLLVAILGGLIFIASKIEKIPSVHNFLHKLSGTLNTHISLFTMILILIAMTVIGIIYVKVQDKRR